MKNKRACTHPAGWPKPVAKARIFPSRAGRHMAAPLLLGAYEPLQNCPIRLRLWHFGINSSLECTWDLQSSLWPFSPHLKYRLNKSAE